MAEQTHEVQVGDRLTALSVTIKQPNASGVDTVVDLTSKTVEFRLVDQSGTDVVAQTTTGVTVDVGTAGTCEYAFSAAAVATAGRFYAYFVVTSGGLEDTFPVESRDLVVCVKDPA
jgi:hypothetical protein